MAKRKPTPNGHGAAASPEPPRKRSLDAAEAASESTPSKRRRSLGSDAVDADEGLAAANGAAPVAGADGRDDAQAQAAATTNGEPLDGQQDTHAATTPRKRGRPPKASLQAASTASGPQTPVKLAGDGATPRRRGRPPKASLQAASTASGPQTPVKQAGDAAATPRRQQAADRSARKKSARALMESVVHNGGGGGDDDGDDDALARQIYEASEADDDGDDDQDEEEDDQDQDQDGVVDHRQHGNGEPAVATPSHATTPRRRRPRARSPSPPRDLPPHELYFAHNRPGRPKTSDKTLGSLALLSHQEYFDVLRRHVDRHAADIANLESLHAESFPQWAFELEQGFNLCLYGFGSKRNLLLRFARHLHTRTAAAAAAARHRTVVVNGYAPAATMRDILAVVARAVCPEHPLPAAAPAATVRAILAQLTAAGPDRLLTLVVHSIDAPPLRKPAMQAPLAQLAAHPRVRLVCSADTPDFPLLWDIGLRSAFAFAFHDATTFAPLALEVDAVDVVHELLGRAPARVNGRDGVAFVLRSLPDNARCLFRLLVGEILVAMDGDDDDDAAAAAAASPGVEYRMIYNKAVEEFICTSEMAFRTLLKEFHDHQMITSRKDALGTELLSVPFQRDELEAMLEDLTS